MTALDAGLAFAGNRTFRTTQWTVVLQARRESSAAAAEALEMLCHSYWYPLYAYIRRKGYPPHDAQDLTQEFFSRLLRGRFLDTVERRKGKFRSFLLASLEHFLAKEWIRARRQKRGGGTPIVSLDEQDAEERYLSEPSGHFDAYKIFERRWALTLLEQTLRQLEAECRENAKLKLFSIVKGVLAGTADDTSYSALSSKLEMSEGAFRVSLHRLRQRYGVLLRAEILKTVSSKDEVDEEIQCLYAALSQ